MRFRFCAVVLSLFSIAWTAGAQVQRTFVSGTGSDANPCSRTAPCRNFAAALSATFAGGEVIVLDSAGYGPVSITQSVSMIAPPGVYGGITAFSGDAIAINAGNGTVVLRGLTLNGIGAANGVDATAVAVLHIEDCVINGFSNDGVLDASPSSELLIDGTTERASGYGALLAPSSGSLSGVIDHSRFEKNQFHGIALSTGTKFTISSTLALHNGASGIVIDGGAVDVKDCVTSNNGGSGVFGTTGTVNVANTIATGNNTGFGRSTATFNSYGNNQLQGNTTAESPGITAVSQQ